VRATPDLTGLTIAAVDVDHMVAFYNAVFDAALAPFEAAGTTLYRGQLHGIPVVICPNSLAGVDATQNRHQFTYSVADLDGLLAVVEGSGGVVRERSGDITTVLDPDGNTIIFRRG
jgi:predicted enzyme related to lactoylglutathione lyase